MVWCLIKQYIRLYGVTQLSTVTTLSLPPEDFVTETALTCKTWQSTWDSQQADVAIIREPFEKFVDSLYYSESELCGGAVTVSFSKYLPWQVIHFLQRSTHFSKTCCRPLITSKFLASYHPFHGWKCPEIATIQQISIKLSIGGGGGPGYKFRTNFIFVQYKTYFTRGSSRTLSNSPKK
jgi:hypothetical protein